MSHLIGHENLDILNILTKVRQRGAAINLGALRNANVDVDPPARTVRRVPPPATSDLPRLEAVARDGISLVTCARNRTDNLVEAIQSWIELNEIDEIVVVDWTSDIPVAEDLAARGIRDPRLRVVRVHGEEKWTLSYAYNAGFRLSRFDRIVKADADILINPDFFARNPLPDQGFVAGNWKLASKDQQHTNGFFYIHRAALARVGGFNEFITSYGWDDDDLYDRLAAAGAPRRDVVQETIYHQPHGDEERLEEAAKSRTGSAYDLITGNPHFGIRRNRYLVELMPDWKPHLEPLPMSYTVHPDGSEALERRAAHPNAVPRFVAERADDTALRIMASWRLGQSVLGLEDARLRSLLSAPASALSEQDVRRALRQQEREATGVPDLAAPAYVPHRTRLYIDAQHGLGNRLRAMGSAAAVAEATGRELVVVWQPDDHCQARLTDLYDYDGAVIEESFSRDARRLGARVYNYMEIEDGAQKDAPIDLTWAGDLYARSAYVLNCSGTSWEAENAFLQGLTPVSQVRDLVASVPAPNDLSVHVRMVGGAKDAHLSYESTDNWTEESQAEIGFWRNKSHFSAFLKRVEALRAQGEADRIFVAADTPEAYRAFKATFGGSAVHLHRELYDRSSEQLAYALADAILLGRAPRLLGSTWSSFTELALRLAPAPLAHEMSGKDF